MREPPRYDFRLEDLRAWDLVEASCRRCRHKATIAHELRMRGRPSFTRLFDLSERGAAGVAVPAARPR